MTVERVASTDGTGPQTQVVLHAGFTAKPGSETQVEKLILTYADEVRAESGNLRFDLYRREDARREFFVFEIYRDRAAFEAHLAAEAGRAFNRALADHVEGSGSELRFLTPVTSR